jgi:hypothetical protein
MAAHSSESTTTNGRPQGFDGAARNDGSRTLAVTTQVLGVLLLLAGGVLVYLLIAVWPAVRVATAQQAGEGISATVELFGFLRLALDPDSALLVLVVVTSALGSYVHAATSFATYVGNRALAMSWIWWYLLRVFIGTALAAIFYLAVRGGFLAAQADTGDVNPYGIAALAGLVGLFSKQATDKLEEVFTTLFRVQERKGDALRGDKAAPPRPRLVGVEPKTVRRRETASLRLLGEGFTPESAVRVSQLSNGRSEVIADQRVTSETTIDLTIDGRFLDEPGQLELTVVNPAPGGGISNALLLPIEDVEPKAPARRMGTLQRLRGRRSRGRKDAAQR